MKTAAKVLVVGCVVAILQVGILEFAAFLWGRSLGEWTTTMSLGYLVGFTLVGPVVGRVAACRMVGSPTWTSWWRAWPVAAVSIFFLLIGHELEDQYGAVAAVSVLGMLAFVAGAAMTLADVPQRVPPRVGE
jgi:hypothetical protein